MTERSSQERAVPSGIAAGHAAKLLDVLCIQYGFCLSPLWRARLTSNPPSTPLRFTDAVFHAEGLDPVTADSQLYKSVHTKVQAAFERPRSPGDGHDV